MECLRRAARALSASTLTVFRLVSGSIQTSCCCCSDRRDVCDCSRLRRRLVVMERLLLPPDASASLRGTVKDGGGGSATPVVVGAAAEADSRLDAADMSRSCASPSIGLCLALAVVVAHCACREQSMPFRVARTKN